MTDRLIAILETELMKMLMALGFGCFPGAYVKMWIAQKYNLLFNDMSTIVQSGGQPADIESYLRNAMMSAGQLFAASQDHPSPEAAMQEINEYLSTIRKDSPMESSGVPTSGR